MLPSRKLLYGRREESDTVFDPLIGEGHREGARGFTFTDRALRANTHTALNLVLDKQLVAHQASQAEITVMFSRSPFSYRNTWVYTVTKPHRTDTLKRVAPYFFQLPQAKGKGFLH